LAVSTTRYILSPFPLLPKTAVFEIATGEADLKRATGVATGRADSGAKAATPTTEACAVNLPVAAQAVSISHISFFCQAGAGASIRM
jgi:hypothetical protein